VKAIFDSKLIDRWIQYSKEKPRTSV